MVSRTVLCSCSLPLLALCSLLSSSAALAGPPYTTDDPEPVELRHWEVYLATMPSLSTDGAFGTAPHVEINYGALPNLQLHTILPLVYNRPHGGPLTYGPGDIEVGAKYRFIQEGDWVPMVGTFPQFELPTGSEARGLGTGSLHLLIPLWLQKSFGDFSTYGGGGYWINPGAGNRNFWLFGWQGQYKVAKWVSPGLEIFYTSADRIGGSGSLRFNVGAVFDLSEEHHILLSAGRSITADTLFQGYLAYQLTL
jgi:Putative MetA-pathway of phenol degradation